MGPSFFCKEMFCTGARRCMLSFSQRWNDYRIRIGQIKNLVILGNSVLRAFATSKSVHPISSPKTLVHMQGMSRCMECLRITWSKSWSPIKMLEFLGLFMTCTAVGGFVTTCTVKMMEYMGFFVNQTVKMRELWGFLAGIMEFPGFFVKQTVNMLEFSRILCEPYGRHAGNSWIFHDMHGHMLEFLVFFCEINHQIDEISRIFLGTQRSKGKHGYSSGQWAIATDWSDWWPSWAGFSFEERCCNKKDRNL